MSIDEDVNKDEVNLSERLNNNRAYCMAVDSAAAVTHSVVMFAPVEYFVLGMDGPEVLGSRIANSISSFLFAGVQGQFKNFVFKKTNTTRNSSKLKKFAVENLAAAFYIPVYTLAATVSSMVTGADWSEIGCGTMTVAAALPLITITYGGMQNAFRYAFGVKSAYDQVIQEESLDDKTIENRLES